MTTELPIPHRRAPSADLVALSEKDVAGIARFIASQSGRTKESVEAHLRWFLLENPACQPQDPLGFGLWSADQLVGCILCSPQAFCFNGNRIVLMGSSSFYVDERHRGHGFEVRRMHIERARGQHPLRRFMHPRECAGELILTYRLTADLNTLGRLHQMR